MTVYLDTSVVLRAILRDAPVLTGWGRWQKAYASDLLGTEARRALDRLRLSGALDDPNLALAHESLRLIEQGIGRVPLGRRVLRRAALPLPTVVKTLDAIHLTSALLLQESRVPELVFVTHDLAQATAARALGFACLGV